MHIVSKTEKQNGESGNVLFLILIAVALFAALSYAVTQSSRSGGGDAGKETNLVNSAQLTQYPSGIRTAIVRMIIGGADIASLEFNAPSAFGSLTATTPVGVLGVFHPNGGGATYTQSPNDVMAGATPGTWIFNGENQIFNIGTSENAATPTAATVDIISFLPGISTSVCNKLNEELGLPATPVAETGVDVTTIMGSTTPGLCNGGCGGTIGDNADAANRLNGQPFGCFSQGGQFVYFHVLVER